MVVGLNFRSQNGGNVDTCKYVFIHIFIYRGIYVYIYICFVCVHVV